KGLNVAGVCPCFWFFFFAPLAAPGCRRAAGRTARPERACSGATASLRRTRWRGFGLSLRSDA
ncbi:hypothetical protein, partial [Escherichia coli]|uniref:hypothetical protein n=1 Tax=Escherichia coli TaxID=562 RepID=UPI0011E91531